MIATLVTNKNSLKEHSSPPPPPPSPPPNPKIWGRDFRWTILYIKANVLSVCLCVRHRHSWIVARAAAAGGRARSQKINKIKIKLAALHLCVCLSWFKETEGLHSVRRSRVPTSVCNNIQASHK